MTSRQSPGFPVETLQLAVEGLIQAWKDERASSDGLTSGDLVLRPQPDGTIAVLTVYHDGSHPPFAVLRAQWSAEDSDKIMIETTRVPFDTMFTRTYVGR